MHVKLFEVRDDATCIAAIGIRPGTTDLISIDDLTKGVRPHSLRRWKPLSLTRPSGSAPR